MKSARRAEGAGERAKSRKPGVMILSPDFAAGSRLRRDPRLHPGYTAHEHAASQF
jgi:hypothetical protein